MSKSATASTSKLPVQLPAKSAWAKGPPSASASPRNSTTPTTRPSSPAPNAATPPASVSHSRRPSTLGQGVSIKDGVSVPRSTASTVKQGSPVTFGSIDDASAPISSSPANVPTIKSQGVKTFGTVPAANPSQQVNGKAAPNIKTPTAITPSASSSSLSTMSSAASSTAATTPSAPSPAPSITKPNLNRADIAKMFMNPGSSSSAPAPEASPPRPSHIPPQPQTPSHQSAQLPPTPSQPSPMGAHAYSTFVPSAGFRPPPQQQNGNGGPGGPSPVPRSPVYSRQMTNGQGSRPPQGPQGPGVPQPSMTPALPSPRMSQQHAHPHPPPTPGLPPQPMPMAQGWPQYYYPNPYQGMPPDPHMQAYSPGWYIPQLPPHQQHPHHPPPPGQPGPPHVGMPISPRNAPPPLAGPGTPTLAHAVPAGLPHPGPGPGHQHQGPPGGMGGMASPPPTPGGAGPGAGQLPRLNSNASTFVPGGAGRKVVIKDELGRELNVGELGKQRQPYQQQNGGAPPTPTVRDPRRSSVRIESQEAKERREREERLRKDKDERERKEKEERLRKEKEERERKAKEEEERKVKEEEDRLKKEEEERVRKAEAEERERVRLEEEAKEQERLRLEEEERVRKEAEEAERQKKEEADRVQREEEEERERARVAAEEEAKRKIEEDERLRLAAEEKKQADETAAAAAASAAAEAAEAEDGEVVEKTITESPTKTKESLRIDTTTPTSELARKRPGPLDLRSAQRQNISASLPSALATARIIEDISSISYPEGILSPKVELNVNAKTGKFRYDRDFLLQFMSVCKEKPDMLPPLDAIGLEPADQTSHYMQRGGSGRRTSSAMAPPSIGRAASVGLGIMPGGGGFSKQVSGSFSMGQFATGKSSEERFAMSSGNRTPSSAGGPGAQFGGRPTPMARTASQSGSGRTRSKRGERRPDKAGPPSGSAFNHQPPTQYGPNGQVLEPVAPLEKSQNAWAPVKKSQGPDPDSPEMVDRKVKGLLNKLTMEKFDSISDQIIAWANKSTNESDGRTLIQVIRLVFEKATDEAAWSEMYARLCRKMMEFISPEVQDEGIKGAEGKPIAGGQLFRKYLLNRCQEDFERGWAQKEATATAAAAKSSEDKAAKAAADGKVNKDGEEEVALYSEEYYAAQKAKRQGLGLVKFIGELFKLQMLTERIMHECVKKLLGNVENPEEEEIESLCKLMATVGQILDTPRARPHMDIYFTRMKELTKNANVSSRMVFMLQDLLELRDRKWQLRNAVAAPSTLSQVHQDDAKQRDKDAHQRNLNMSRGGSRRGGDRGDPSQIGPDGWAVAGGSAPPRAPPKAGDLSQFGKINKPTSMTFAPTSVFGGKKDAKRDAPASRPTSSNMYAMLSQNPEIAAEVAAAPAAGKGSRPPSRKPSVDLGQNVPEPTPTRRKLNLLPRSKPVEDAVSTPVASESSGDEEGAAEDTAPSMSEAEATKKIREDLKEFFAVRNIDEGEEYFRALPTEHHFHLVDQLVNKAIESKLADAELVASLFKRAVDKNLCTPEAFEAGFMPVAELLDDIAIDAPKAVDLMATMMKGAALDDERNARIAEKSGVDRLLGLLSS